MAEPVGARNAVQALTRTELFGAAHSTRQPGCARAALLDTHVTPAPLVATLARQLRRQQYRRACSTLEQLVSLLCGDDAAVVYAFVRVGGVAELWRVLLIDPVELAAHYRRETPRTPRDASTNELFNLIMRLVGHNAPSSAPRPPDSDDEDESGDGEREEESADADGSDHGEQGDEQQEESEGVVGDPALGRFGAEDSADEEEGRNNGEEEEEDLYVPPGGTGEGLSSMAQIAATMINQPRHSEWLLTALRKYSVLLLRESAYIVPTVSKETVRSQPCMTAIFSFLDERSTFFLTIPLLEELSAQNIAKCYLASQGAFIEHAKGFKPYQVLFSSRFIANMCFDPMQNRSNPRTAVKFLEPLKQQEVDEMMSVVGNQTAVCEIPGFIENLIKLLKSQTILYNSLVERMQKDIPIPGDESVLVAFDNWSRIEEKHRPLTTLTRENMSEASASSVITASRQPDMFFILFTLLSGCRKLDVQKRCADAGIVDVITRFIESTSWDTHPPLADDDQHVSNLEISVKVQLLRLLINFCDRRSSYKRLLMTPEEIQQAIDGRFEIIPRPGLVSKIMSLVMRDQENSVPTSWMCASLEAFLRGADPCVHWWMTQFGLTTRLVEIVATESSQQIYDLLSEIIKWEPRQVIFLEGLLKTVDAESFFDQVIKHPVDSSFLVRSIVLLTMKYPDIIESECPMIYIWLHDNSIPFVSAVFDELEVKSIYQDNLCCVATACLLCKWSCNLGMDVIRLVLQNKKKQCTDTEYLDNMLDIIAFWNKYHIIRGVERYKVEQSHHLPFSFFIEAATKVKKMICEYKKNHPAHV